MFPLSPHPFWKKPEPQVPLLTLGSPQMDECPSLPTPAGHLPGPPSSDLPPSGAQRVLSTGEVRVYFQCPRHRSLQSVLAPADLVLVLRESYLMLPGHRWAAGYSAGLGCGPQRGSWRRRGWHPGQQPGRTGEGREKREPTRGEEVGGLAA